MRLKRSGVAKDDTQALNLKGGGNGAAVDVNRKANCFRECRKERGTCTLW